MNRFDQPPGGTSSTDQAIDSAVAGLQDTARAAAQHVERAADNVGRAGREAAEGVRDVASTFAEAFEESLRNRPMATVGVVAMAGFVLGALWKS